MALSGRIRSGVSLFNELTHLTSDSVSAQRSTFHRSLIAPFASQGSRYYFTGSDEEQKPKISYGGGKWYLSRVEYNWYVTCGDDAFQVPMAFFGGTRNFVADLYCSRLEFNWHEGIRSWFFDLKVALAEYGRLRNLYIVAKRFKELTMARQREVKGIVTTVIIDSSVPGGLVAEFECQTPFVLVKITMKVKPIVIDGFK